MRRIIDDPNALDTSKVQAARALALLTEEHSGRRSTKESEWLAVREALEQLPVEDRLQFLRAEMGRSPLNYEVISITTGNTTGSYATKQEALEAARPVKDIVVMPYDPEGIAQEPEEMDVADLDAAEAY